MNKIMYIIIVLLIISNCYSLVYINRIRGTLQNRKVEINMLDERITELENNKQVQYKNEIRYLSSPYEKDLEDKMKTIEWDNEQKINRLKSDMELNQYSEQLRTSELERKLNSYDTDINGILHYKKF